MIKCKTCGKENLDGAKFCLDCGNRLLESSNFEQSTEIGMIPSQKEVMELECTFENDENKQIDEVSYIGNDTICPICKSSGCQPMFKNNTNIQSSSYSLKSGCCGLFLLGPFGLLCGLCGKKTTVTTENETWWTCMKCGNQHISKKDAVAKFFRELNEYVGASGLGTFIVGFIVSAMDIGIWGVLIDIIVCIGTPIYIFEKTKTGISKLLGYDIREALTSAESEQCEHYKWFGLIASIAGILATPILLLMAG